MMTSDMLEGDDVTQIAELNRIYSLTAYRPIRWRRLVYAAMWLFAVAGVIVAIITDALS